MGGIDIIIANISLEKNYGFSVKFLAKDMHQILPIEFKNCIFFSFSGEVPPQTPPFFNGQKFIVPDKGIKTRKVGGKTRKVGGIDIKIAKMNNGFQ